MVILGLILGVCMFHKLHDYLCPICLHWLLWQIEDNLWICMICEYSTDKEPDK